MKEKNESDEKLKFQLAKLQEEKEIELAGITASGKYASHVSDGECIERPRLLVYKIHILLLTSLGLRGLLSSVKVHKEAHAV